MSTTYDGTQEPRGDRQTEAERLLAQVLGMRDELPDPNDLIDLAAARQLRTVGHIEASLARRAERDAAVSAVVRGGDDARVELRHHRAKAARRRAAETDLVAKLLEQSDRTDLEAVREQAVKDQVSREKAAAERAAKQKAAAERVAREKDRKDAPKRDRRG